MLIQLAFDATTAPVDASAILYWGKEPCYAWVKGQNLAFCFSIWSLLGPLPMEVCPINRLTRRQARTWAF